ncbi:unnamed protein product, partial [Phaeothamnion confervicola]
LSSISERDAVTAQLLADDGAYLQRLLDVFSDAEDLEDEASLRLLCEAMKRVVALNDQALVEALLSDRFFLQVAGVFEHDPELKAPAFHRDFLTNTVKFCQVMPIEDPEVVARIHQNFRISFLKDMLLRPMLDDAIVGTLNAMTCYNNAEIVAAVGLGGAGDYAERVFGVLRDPDLPRQRRASGLAFLRELFAMVRTLQLSAREAFYRAGFPEPRLFDVLVPVLRDPAADVSERMACMDILLSTLTHEPGLLRNHILHRGSHPPPPPHASGAGGAGGTGGTDSGSGSNGGGGGSGSLLGRRLGGQASEVVRMLLDTDTMETQSERDAFLGAFYDVYVNWLVEPFWTANPNPSLLPGPPARHPAAPLAKGGGGIGDAKGGRALTSPPPSVGMGAAAENGAAGAEAGAHLGDDESASAKAAKGHACDLLSFCVRAHTYRMKYFVLRHSIVARVLRLLQYRDKFLKLGAVRFLRSCVGMKDEFYNRYIIKNNLFAPVFALLKENAGRDNLINSAVVELVE